METDEENMLLKKFLLQLPIKADFDFNKNVKKEIRKALFMSISSNGEYLNWLFPSVFLDNQSYQRDDMIKKVEDDY